jgi:hypothetical protein
MIHMLGDPGSTTGDHWVGAWGPDVVAGTPGGLGEA